MSVISEKEKKPDEDVDTSDGHTLPSSMAPSIDNDKPVVTPAPAEEVKGLKLLVIMIGITLACFLMLVDIAILATAIPYITNDFHSISDVGWYGAAYQLSSAALLPTTGKFYANFSVKWTFFAFFAIFELGSLLCAVSVSSNMLIIGRAVAGLGASGIQNGAFTIIASIKPMAKRPTLIGITIGVAQFGLVIGPLIGGALTEYVSWRWCFWINLPCGAIVAVLLGFLHIPELFVKQRPLEVLKNLHHRLDLVGFVLFAPWVIMLLLAVQWGGNQYAWNNSVIIGLFVGSGVNALVWLGWERYKGDAAMVPFNLLKKRVVWSGCLTYGLLLGAMFTMSYWLPIYFQAVKGATPTLSGVYLLPSVVPQLICSIVAGRLLNKLGYYLPFILFGSVLYTIGYGLCSTLLPHSSTGDWIGYQILFGVGRGIGLQMPVVAVQNNLAPDLISIALALVIFTSTFFGALFLSFAETVFTNSLQSLLHKIDPGINVPAVVASGATKFRTLVPEGELTGALYAYSKSIDRVFYMLTAFGACSFLAAWGLGWKDIRQKSPLASKA